MSTTCLLQAARDCIQRANRTQNPIGEFDKAKRWRPSNAEHRECCDYIRSPSHAWPFSLLIHCRTAEHVAALHNVDTKELRRLVRRAKALVAAGMCVDDAIQAAVSDK